MVDPTQRIAFTTFGMLILDELHFPSEESLINIIGGSGTFSTIDSVCVFGPFQLDGSVFWLCVHPNDNR